MLTVSLTLLQNFNWPEMNGFCSFIILYKTLLIQKIAGQEQMKLQKPTQGTQQNPIQRVINVEHKKLKIVAVSDIHGQYYSTKHLSQQSGDIFIIAGDFTFYGSDKDFDSFFQFLDSLKNFKHKIVIAGNHEIAMDQSVDVQRIVDYYRQYQCKYNRQYIISELKKRAIYLEHQFIEVEGLKIFASPYTSYFCGSAFQVKPPQLKMLWDKIPEGLDILITHGPPYQIFDKTAKKVHAGCPLLLQKVKQVKPKIHIFGHIHQGRPRFGQKNHIEAHGTKFYNVAQRPQIIQFSLIQQ